MLEGLTVRNQNPCVRLIALFPPLPLVGAAAGSSYLPSITAQMFTLLATNQSKLARHPRAPSPRRKGVC